MGEAKQVIVVRKDLNMRKGKIAAQVAHASLGAFLKLCSKETSSSYLNIIGQLKKGTPEFEWINGPFTKICVYCESEGELLALVEQAKEKNILHCLITDAGKTEFNGIPTKTCCAFGPDWSERIDSITGNLKLL